MPNPEVFMPTLGYVRDHIITNSVIVLLVLVVVTLRVIGRRLGPGLGIDDALVLFATPLGVTMLVCQGKFARVGNGYDLATNPQLAANVPFILELTFGMQLVYILLLAATKASVLFFYIRVFVTPWVQRASRLMLAFVGAWMLSYMFACIFICTPVSAQWTGLGVCGAYIHLIQSLIATNALGDVLIMGLPMHSVWNLKMNTTDKIGITASFGLGIACVVCAVFRLIHISTVDLQLNVTGTMPTTILLFTLEPNLAILCISIPMLRPFYVLYRKRVGGSRLAESDDRTSGFRSNLKYASNGGVSSSRPDIITTNETTWEMDDYNPAGKAMHSNTVFTSDRDESESEKDLTTGSRPRNKSEIVVSKMWTVSRS